MSAAPDLTAVDLKSGGHTSRDDGVCATEAAAWMAGLKLEPCEKCAGHGWNGSACEKCGGWGVVARAIVRDTPHTDHPDCMSPVLGAFLRRLNDRLGDAERQRLKPYVYRALGTAGDGHDELRGWLAADWSIRVALPTWLELAGANESAQALRDLPGIVDRETARQARATAREARTVARRIRDERLEPLKERVRQAVKEKLAERPAAVAAAVADAVAVADADAVADAVAAAVADAVADAVAVAAAVAAAVKYDDRWWKVYDAVNEAVYPKYKEALTEKVQAQNAEFLPSALVLLDRMIDPEKEVV